MPHSRRVLIYSMVEHTARRQIVRGIGIYGRERPIWQPLIPWADLERWARPEGMKVDGVIAYPHTREEMDFLLDLDLPVVCVGPFFPEPGLPRVSWDDGVAGQLAVRHLADAGLKRIGFAGSDFGEGYVRSRLEGAERAAAELGLELISLDLEPEGHRPGKEKKVARRAEGWLKGLQPPFGLVAATDFTGFALLYALRSARIEVPEAAAVISIGGDNLVCPFCEPALSSVVLPGAQVGYQAAQLLDRLIKQRKAVGEIRVPPQRVVVRRSSDTFATSDEMVRRALSFIREHAVQPIGVGDVLAAVPLSRRPLELRFKRATGRTLQKEIWRVRLKRAKEMLIETNLSIADIAENCGFNEPQRMSEVFTRELGEAPGAFRKAHHRMAGHD